MKIVQPSFHRLTINTVRRTFFRVSIIIPNKGFFVILTYLKENKEEGEILEILSFIEDGYISLNESNFENKIEYIKGLYELADCDTVEFIEKLYTEE